MGNARQKYTDEEYEEILKNIKKYRDDEKNNRSRKIFKKNKRIVIAEENNIVYTSKIIEDPIELEKSFEATKKYELNKLKSKS
jgi:hypothetical protein